MIVSLSTDKGSAWKKKWDTAAHLGQDLDVKKNFWPGASSWTVHMPVTASICLALESSDLQKAHPVSSVGMPESNC
jgi:hypothetical protein